MRTVPLSDAYLIDCEAPMRTIPLTVNEAYHS
jgi:hypothetical protein